MRRRDFLYVTALGSLGTLCGCQHVRAGSGGGTPRLFYTSAGKTCMINVDGTGQETFSFDVPNQATWQPCGFFRDGHRALFLSMEPRRDGPGRPFAEYYHQTPTHIWAYDLESKALTELATKDRLAPFCTPQLLLSDERMLVQVVRKGDGQTYSMNVDGSDAQEFTKAGEGMPYGLSASPGGKHVAYHLASPQGYQIWTCDSEGGNRVRLAGAPGHLYFGTSWSPDGQWVLYVDCLDGADPGHDWADVCISRADGSEQRVLTTGQAMWFAATYGDLKTRGGGSNLPAWTHDGAIIFPRRLPGTKVPWEYRVGQPDTDHFKIFAPRNRPMAGTLRFADVAWARRRRSGL
ncbi:MAG: serine/threonine protein kinase [Candidatus Hydrogenedentes bacterium]|nr:serine/threonine protein kinase [Candidatus Hydrogenedentota bacterium]